MRFNSQQPQRQAANNNTQHKKSPKILQNRLMKLQTLKMR